MPIISRVDMLQRVLKRLSDKKKVTIFIIVYYLIFLLLQVPKSLKVFYIVHFIEEGGYGSFTIGRLRKFDDASKYICVS